MIVKFRVYGRALGWLAAIGMTMVMVMGLAPSALAVDISDTPLDAEALPEGTVVIGQTLIDHSVMYQTRYRVGLWTGDVLALTFNPQTGLADQEAGRPLWSAAAQLRKPGVTHDSRRIVSYGGIWLAPRGVPFRYDDLSDTQKRMLGSDLTVGSPADRTARRLVDYLRGREMSEFRRRRGRLGDIVHAAPVLAGKTLFVGANDGMLHAFDAGTGQERFAYVPHLVFGHLDALAASDYAENHRFYVDATPYVGEVVEDTYQRSTYLVGGLGKGGRGYYCLKIGSRRRVRTGTGFGPYRETFSVDGFGRGTGERHISRIVRWEYPRPVAAVHENGDDHEVADPDMGYSFGQGYVVNAYAPEGQYRPVAVFGNGYNSPDGSAVLYVLDARDGSLVRKIDTGSGGGNGLSTPALVDVTLDRRVDYVYAGDLKGNLWKFDLRSDDPRYWGVAYGADLNGDGVIDAADGDVPRPLFQARGQPITGRPDVMAMHSACGPRGGGVMVVFGTGRYLGPPDRHDTSQQSIYGIWDAEEDGRGLGYLTRRSSGRLSSGRYLARREVVEYVRQDGQLARRLSDWTAQPASGVDEDIDSAGWFFDFPGVQEPYGHPGERVTGNVVIRGGMAILVSFAPSVEPGRREDASWVNILSICGNNGKGEVPFDPLYLSRRVPGRITGDPAFFKPARASRLELIMLGDDAGAVAPLPWPGEADGRVFWRQDLRE